MVQAARAPEVTATLTGDHRRSGPALPALKLFAVEELGRQPGGRSRPSCPDLLTDQKTAPLAQQKAGEMLIARRDAGALDLLSGGAARARGLLREAAGAAGRGAGAGHRRAGAAGGRSVTPDLEAHLGLPETPPAAAAEIARALVQTGATDSTGSLRDFLSMYRSESGL